MTGPLAIYATFEPRCRERGLTPVAVGDDKAPLGRGWANPSPSEEDFAERLRRYANANIGVLAGTSVGDCIFAFVDCDDDRLIAFIAAFLGITVCAKEGLKGITHFVLALPGVKSFKLYGPGKRPVLEFMLNSGMTVIPPSLHPSGKRYRWIGKSLFDIDLRQLPMLDPTKIEILRLIIKSVHAWAIIDGGAGVAGHDPMLRLTSCGIATMTDDLEWLERILAALFHPDYRGDTKAEIGEMLRSAAAKKLGGRKDQKTYDPGESGPQPLGYTREGLYALRDRQCNIIKQASANQLLSMQWLLGLAPSAFWAERYPSEKGMFNFVGAGEALIAACKSKGPFSPHQIRGRGIWIEEGQIVVNLGGPVPPGLKHQYLCFEPIHLDPDATFDTARLLTLLKRLRWRDPHHAVLLLGWLAIAPICGVLSWRPHCFVYGPPKSGKSTLHELARTILAPLAVATTGDSSEAGIRQSVGPDSLPVIIDEFESDQRRGKQQAIVMLARSASSGEVPILRGTPEGRALQFSLRVAFFFSGINPAGLSPADASRILLLELMMHENDQEAGRWITAEVAAFSGLGPRWCGYMASKALEIGPAREVFELAMPGMDARLRTNMATLLAGAFVALHGRRPDESEAAERVAEFAATTAQHADDVDRDDAFECLHFLFAHVIDGTPVGQWLARELRDRTHRRDDGRRPPQIANSLDIVLKTTGKDVGIFLLRGAPGLDRIYANTKWAEGGWMLAIRKLDSMFSPQDPIHFPSISRKARGIGLPFDLLPPVDDGGEGGVDDLF